jgi:hypothetical protein
MGGAAAPGLVPRLLVGNMGGALYRVHAGNKGNAEEGPRRWPSTIGAVAGFCRERHGAHGGERPAIGALVIVDRHIGLLEIGRDGHIDGAIEMLCRAVRARHDVELKNVGG